MNRLFVDGTRVVINTKAATLYAAGADHMTIVYDTHETSIIEKEGVLKAYKEQKLYLIDETGFDISIDDEGNVDKKVVWKLAHVNALVALKVNYKSRKRIEAVINQVAVNYPEMKKPSISAVYNWVTMADSLSLKAAQVSALKLKKRKCDSRLSTHVNELVFDAIDAYYMTPLVSSISKAYKEFKKTFKKEFPDNKIDEPHKSTFYNRVKKLCPFEVELKRKGRAAAKLLKRTAIQEMCAAEILEQVQFDAVHLNIPLYDDEKNLLGKPVIHIAIDVYSRAILGFSIELGSESSAGVNECIRSAVSIKLHEDHPYTLNRWEMYGKPFEAITDGGAAYISETVTSMFSILNIVRSVNASYTPWHKAIVERFNLTLRMQFAVLFKSYVGRKKDGRDLHTLKKFSEKVTLTQFRKALTCYIVDDYNQSPHNSLLERTPHNTWESSAVLSPPMVPHSLSRAMLFRGNLKSAVLHHVQGIRINCVYYNSRELQKAFAIEYGQRITDRIKVNFQYDPMNIKQIIIRMNGRLITVPSYKADYPVYDGMTFVENKAKRLKVIRKARELFELQKNRVGISDKLNEFVNEGVTDKPIDRSKKQGDAIPLEKVNEKMGFAKSINSTSNNNDEVEEFNEEIDEVNDIDTEAYFSDLIFDDDEE